MSTHLLYWYRQVSCIGKNFERMDHQQKREQSCSHHCHDPSQSKRTSKADERRRICWQSEPKSPICVFENHPRPEAAGELGGYELSSVCFAKKGLLIQLVLKAFLCQPPAMNKQALLLPLRALRPGKSSSLWSSSKEKPRQKKRFLMVWLFTATAKDGWIEVSFTLIFSSPTAFAMTQRKLSTRYPVLRQPKKRKKERHDIENKKLALFEQAVVAIKAPTLLPAMLRHKRPT